MTGEQKPGGLEGDASGVEREESAGDMLSRLGMDGKLWAEEFQKTALTLGYPEMDDGWLLGWFCNAIMAGYDHARRKYDPEILAHFRPQPSGETLGYEIAGVVQRLNDCLDMSPKANGVCVDTGDIRAILALIRPAPVASGGQHSSGEDAAWTWLNGHVECDPADRDYSADEMVDAFMAGAGRYDRWSKALERIAGEHQHRSGYCQTDITVEPALTAEEAQTVARDALSGTPVQSTAPVASSDQASESGGDRWPWLKARVDTLVNILAPDQGEMLTEEGRRLFAIASAIQSDLAALSAPQAAPGEGEQS